MENQHRHIKGDRELDASEIELINLVKKQGKVLGAVVDAAETMLDVDKRAIAIAKTHLQTGLMWLVRGIARPEGF